MSGKFNENKYADKSLGLEVIIGNDVWIGADVTILAGSIIGDGVIVASGAVVSGCLEPFGIYGGVPAKLIRYRFSEEQINYLLRYKWWNKDESWLIEHADLFDNIEKFMGLIEKQ